jgi:hypothetical protein
MGKRTFLLGESKIALSDALKGPGNRSRGEKIRKEYCACGTPLMRKIREIDPGTQDREGVVGLGARSGAGMSRVRTNTCDERLVVVRVHIHSSFLELLALCGARGFIGGQEAVRVVFGDGSQKIRVLMARA